MPYGRHGIVIPPGAGAIPPNSTALLGLFNQHPYQGQDPSRARNVFIALDANWPEVIPDPLLASIGRYFANLGAFWNDHHEHHPLRLLEGEDGGRKYHANVRKLFDFAVEERGFDLGALVNATSFVELLGAPTFGRATHHRVQYFSYAVDQAIFDNIAHIRDVVIGQVLGPNPAPAEPKSVFFVGITTLRWFIRLRTLPQLNHLLNFLGLDPLSPEQTRRICGRFSKHHRA